MISRTIRRYRQSGRGENSPASAAVRAVPYPSPKHTGDTQLMRAVIKALGQFPSNDDEIENRVLPCVMVAFAELAAMHDRDRRDQIVVSMGELAREVVSKLAAATAKASAMAEATDQSLVEMLLNAMDRHSD